MQGPLLSGEESIDGEDCFVVKSHSEMKDRTLALDFKDLEADTPREGRHIGRPYADEDFRL
jgi:hypothetical protein